MKTPLPQIAFDFARDTNAQQEEPSVELSPLSAVPESPSAGESSTSVLPSSADDTASPPDNVVMMPSASVGVRLKHMKEPKIPEGPETGTEAEPETQTQEPSTGPGGHAGNGEPLPRGEGAIDTGITVSFIEPLDPEEGEAAAIGREGKSTRGRKSLKQIAAEADLIEIPADEELFSKQYYTMGEVAGMFRVNQSLLRFWEAEFNILQPRKNKKGDRYFRPVDIKNLHLIYHLLRQRKYTIEGAREFLKNHKKAEQKFEAIRRMKDIKAFLLELKAQL